MVRVAYCARMAREATDELYVKPETKQLVQEAKPDGMTYDLWVRQDPRLPGGVDE